MRIVYKRACITLDSLILSELRMLGNTIYGTEGEIETVEDLDVALSHFEFLYKHNLVYGKQARDI